jgi:uncharacterized short protein YbdD (DUF466 family)
MPKLTVAFRMRVGLKKYETVYACVMKTTHLETNYKSMKYNTDSREHPV